MANILLTLPGARVTDGVSLISTIQSTDFPMARFYRLHLLQQFEMRHDLNERGSRGFAISARA